jgi:hypothetical protein
MAPLRMTASGGESLGGDGLEWVTVSGWVKVCVGERVGVLVGG